MINQEIPLLNLGDHNNKLLIQSMALPGSIISVQNVDLLRWAEKENYSYNSLERSQISSKKKEKIT